MLIFMLIFVVVLLYGCSYVFCSVIMMNYSCPRDICGPLISFLRSVQQDDPVLLDVD